jgi:hypothetical protein
MVIVRSFAQSRICPCRGVGPDGSSNGAFGFAGIEHRTDNDRVPGMMQVGDGQETGTQRPVAAAVAGKHRWRPSRLDSGPYARPGVPNYYIQVPGSTFFDDAFPDWRGPTGGWGSPVTGLLEDRAISGQLVPRH